MAELSGPSRVVIERVDPQVDGGRFAVKRTAAEAITVRARVFADGHDVIAAAVQWRRDGDDEWTEGAMRPGPGDVWRGELTPRTPGRWYYAVSAWIDRYETWRRRVDKKAASGVPLELEPQIGAALVEEAAGAAGDEDDDWLRRRAEAIRATSGTDDLLPLLDEPLAAMMRAHLPRLHASRAAREYPLLVERAKARFSAWYELFPRSTAGAPDEHGTFADVIERLPYIERMGFDVLYLPPIHPIGRTFRKGRNNTEEAEPEDVGSPWAIGAAEGGHAAIHPKLGTEADFCALLEAAKAQGMEVALDLAFQCSPDHPYVREHPEWFRTRPDGSVQYAENPPKKYQDIYPLDFECDDWRALWDELLGVVRYWVDLGVHVFRVDNPHTKPFGFWEWLIESIKREHPDVLFLAEAFSRPSVSYRLAKAGFSQSYTYVAWKNTKHEIETYFTELTQTEVSNYFVPNAWPNTPDILNEYLQVGGRPAFVLRAVLASTLSASYGIYGPVYELCEAEPVRFGSEEYLDSEKYQLRYWDLDQPHSLRDTFARLNQIRRDNPALQRNDTLRFHPTTNDQILCYSKTEPAALASRDRASGVICVVANLDPFHKHAAWIDLDLDEIGVGPDEPFSVRDLIAGSRYLWRGSRNYVEVDPATCPAHVFRIERRVRTEQDFEYFA